MTVSEGRAVCCQPLFPGSNPNSSGCFKRPILPASAGLQQLLLLLGGVEVGAGDPHRVLPSSDPLKLRPQLLKSDSSLLSYSLPVCVCVLSTSTLATSMWPRQP